MCRTFTGIRRVRRTPRPPGSRRSTAGCTEPRVVIDGQRPQCWYDSGTDAARGPVDRRGSRGARGVAGSGSRGRSVGPPVHRGRTHRACPVASRRGGRSTHGPAPVPRTGSAATLGGDRGGRGQRCELPASRKPMPPAAAPTARTERRGHHPGRSPSPRGRMTVGSLWSPARAGQAPVPPPGGGGDLIVLSPELSPTTLARGRRTIAAAATHPAGTPRRGRRWTRASPTRSATVRSAWSAGGDPRGGAG